MKTFFRIAVLSIAVLVYASCQKEVTGIIPDTNPPADSTATGIDSTNNPAKDSLTIVSFSPDSGLIGTTITIKGTGFDKTITGNTVAINTKAATVLGGTDTTLTIQVLEGTESGKISVTANGKTAISLTDFVVLKDSVVTGINVWTRKADCPLGGSTFVNGFSIGGNGYFFDGYVLFQFNPAANEWTRKKDLPADTWHRFGFCFVIGNKAYIGLGANGEAEDFYAEWNSDENYREVWEYDAQQDSWTKKSDFPGAPRVVPFSFAINGNGYVGGGDTTNANLGGTNDFWKYDPVNDRWTKLGAFPVKNAIGFSGFSLSGAGYVLEAGPGNPTAPVSGPYSEKLWKYNAASDTWEQKASLPNPDFVSAVTFTINGKAYAALGVSKNPDNLPAGREDFLEYDPTSDTWTKKADAGGGLRWLGSGFAVGGKGYVGIGTGDYYEDLKDDFWEYTPE